MAEDPAPAPNESPAEGQPGEPPIDSSQIESPSQAASACDAAARPDDAAASASDAPAATADAESQFDQAAIDELLKQANFEDPSNIPAEQAIAATLPDAANFELPNFQQAMQDAQ